MKDWPYVLGLLVAGFVFAPHALGDCAPPQAFPVPAIVRCKWECPDYRKGGAPMNSGPLKHVARCGPQVGKVASYFHGTVTLTGRVERADTITFGDVLVFFPDAKSRGLLPQPLQSEELWFANKAHAARALKAPQLDSRNTCWSAPAKITVAGLLSHLGDQDGNHDWAVLENVGEIGEYRNYGCAFN